MPNLKRVFLEENGSGQHLSSARPGGYPRGVPRKAVHSGYKLAFAKVKPLLLKLYRLSHVDFFLGEEVNFCSVCQNRSMTIVW